MTKALFIPSAFADEAVRDRRIADLEQQLDAVAGQGLLYYTARAFNFSGIPGENVNVTGLNPDQLDGIVKLNKKYGMRVATLGTPIGKAGLVEGRPAKADYKSPEQVRVQLEGAFRAGDKLDCRLIRGFSFYPPDGAKEAKEGEFYSLAFKRLWEEIVVPCKNHGFLFGIEPEPGLTAADGATLNKLVSELPSKNVVGIYDGANLHVAGLDGVHEYFAMRGVLGWFHIKDYNQPCPGGRTVDEEALKHFCPADRGLVGHQAIMDDFASRQVETYEKLRAFGIPGIPADVEGHIDGGGLFGGFSNPVGFGMAVRGLLNVLDRAGIKYELRDHDQMVSFQQYCQ